VAKNGAKLLAAWAGGATFVALSGAVALGWLYEADLWVLRTVRENPSDSLLAALEIFSLSGGLEVAGAALLVLLAALLCAVVGCLRDGSWRSSWLRGFLSL